MIAPTCSVMVTRPARGRDALGIPTAGGTESVTVDGVLVEAAEGAGAQATGTGAGRTAQAALDLHFPKAYRGSLLGCTVTLPGPWEGGWRVVGDPMPHDPRLCPGRWDRRVHVVRPDA